MSKLLSLCVLALLCLLPVMAQAQDIRSLPYRAQADKGFKGDFDVMRERKLVRVLVPYSMTLFYYDGGQQRGVTATMVQEFEKFINQKYGRKGTPPITVMLVPTTRDKLLENLQKGWGDIAAGNITITPERQKIVDFSNPAGAPFSEILITGPGAPEITKLDDLAGKEIHVRPVTSFYASLLKLNADFKKRNLRKIKLTKLPNDLADEDILEMVDAGIIPLAVTDSWVAHYWQDMLPNMKVHDDVKITEESRVGWAFRKNSPLLAAEINEFIEKRVNKEGMAKGVVRDAQAKTKKFINNGTSSEMEKFNKTVEVFKKYGAQYDFDYLMLAAQGYQESRLDQGARSDAGAIGIMQIMPATGKQMKVGDINVADANVHAGTKYMDHLMETYFADAKMDDQNRILFAFASYNAGPGNIRKFRKEAEGKGYNPNIWFDNVERVAAERIGQETVSYVRNIYKYYVAYKLALAVSHNQLKARVKAGEGG